MSIDEILEEVWMIGVKHRDNGVPKMEKLIAEQKAELKALFLSAFPEESHTCVTHRHLPCAGCTVKVATANFNALFEGGEK